MLLFTLIAAFSFSQNIISSTKVDIRTPAIFRSQVRFTNLTPELRLAYILGWEHTTGNVFDVPITQFIDTVYTYGLDSSFFSRTFGSIYPKTITDSLGIGTNNPAEKLDVNGNINISTTSSTVGQIKQNGTTILHTYGSSATRTNLFWGIDAGNFTNATAYGNFSFGYQALKSLTSGDENFAVGYQAMYHNATGGSNIAIGYSALHNNTASDNIAMGNQAMESVTTSTKNIALGGFALSTITTTGGSNIAIGDGSMKELKSGNYNVGVGVNSFRCVANAVTGGNTAIGYSALANDSIAPSNTAIGYQSLQTLKKGAGLNTSVGTSAGTNNLQGARNSYFGTESGYNSTGSDNVFLGYNSGYNETGDNKLYIDNTNSATPLIWGDFATDSVVVNGDFGIRGNSYFYSNSAPATGEPNYFVGEFTSTPGNMYNFRSTMNINLTDSSVNRLGGVLGEAYIKATSKGLSRAVGVYGYIQNLSAKTVNQGYALYGMVSNHGTGTIANSYGLYIDTFINDGGGSLGTPYGVYVANPYENYFGGTINIPATTATVGYLTQGGSRILHTYGTGNLFLGSLSGNFTLSGATNNTGVGLNTLSDLTSGDYNVAIGSRAGDSLTTGISNMLIGESAGASLKDDDNNVYIGFEAGRSNTVSNNIGIGSNALETGSGVGNIAIGMNALTIGGTSASSTIIGYLSGENLVNNDNNTFIGASSGRNANSKYNTFIGMGAGKGTFGTATDDANTFVGMYAGLYLGAGYNNVGLGYGALQSSFGYDLTGTGNVAVGRESLAGMRSGTYNTAIGYRTGYSNLTGTGNVFIGNSAGYNETGSDKLYIENSNADSTGTLIFGNFATNRIKVNGSFSSGVDTIADNDATPDVSGANTFIYNGTANPVSIIDLDNPTPGHYYTFFGNSDSNTLGFPESSTNFKTRGGDITLGQYDNATFYCWADNVYILISVQDVAP